MPRVNVPITEITDDGVAPPAQVVGDPGNDHELAFNDGKVFVEATNDDADADHMVTIVTPQQVEGLAVADVAVEVPQDGGVRLIGPFSPRTFNQPDTGKVHIDVADADVKLRAYHLD